MTFVIVKIVTFYSGDLIRPVPMMVLSNTNNVGKNHDATQVDADLS